VLLSTRGNIEKKLLHDATTEECGREKIEEQEKRTEDRKKTTK